VRRIPSPSPSPSRGRVAERRRYARNRPLPDPASSAGRLAIGGARVTFGRQSYRSRASGAQGRRRVRCPPEAGLQRRGVDVRPRQSRNQVGPRGRAPRLPAPPGFGGRRGHPPPGRQRLRRRGGGRVHGGRHRPAPPRDRRLCRHRRRVPGRGREGHGAGRQRRLAPRGVPDDVPGHPHARPECLPARRQVAQAGPALGGGLAGPGSERGPHIRVERREIARDGIVAEGARSGWLG
jgi:hypothetical protein